MSSEQSSLKGQSPLPNYTNLDKIQLKEVPSTSTSAVQYRNDDISEAIVTQPRKSEEREQDNDEPRRSSGCCDFCCNPDVDDPIGNAAIAGWYCPLIICHPNSKCDCSPDCHCKDCLKCAGFCGDCVSNINCGDCDADTLKCLGLLFCCPVLIVVGILTSGDCNL